MFIFLPGLPACSLKSLWVCKIWAMPVSAGLNAKATFLYRSMSYAWYRCRPSFPLKAHTLVCFVYAFIEILPSAMLECMYVR
jgi:hypothetical protein